MGIGIFTFKMADTENYRQQMKRDKFKYTLLATQLNIVRMYVRSRYNKTKSL